MSQTNRSNPRLNCPHCGSFARIRNSVGINLTLRQALLECTNAECNWRGQLLLSVTHTLSPSDAPNDDVHLPLSPRIRALVEQENQSNTDKTTVTRQTARPR